MKLLHYLFAGAILAAAFTSCKKTDTASVPKVIVVNKYAGAQTEKQTRFNTEINAFAIDANILLQSKAGFNGREADVMGSVCNMIAVIDTIGSNRNVTLTYNGTNCEGTRTFNGVVELSMAAAMQWKDAGAVITANFKNLIITRVNDNKSITINGVINLTNVSGGRLADLAALGSIVHTITGSNLAVTFEDGTKLTLQEATQRTYNYDNGIVINITGTHTEGNVTGVSEWGTDANGASFVTAINNPNIIRQDCQYRLVGGMATNTKQDGVNVVTFGLDALGNPTSCPGTGTYYYKAVWSGNDGTTQTTIMAY